MLIADIKNKLSLSELTSEDFLTSSVFSFFKYVNQNWIESFLKEAINLSNQKLDIKIIEPVYNFQPYYSLEKKYGGGTEPDLIILSDDIAIIIEAKNYSCKSGTGIEIQEDDINSEIKLNDQLGRECFIGEHLLLNSGYEIKQKAKYIKKYYVIFLTRNSAIPRVDIRETIESVHEMDKKIDAESILYWLNWQKIIPILNSILESASSNDFEYQLSQDLLEFLERRNLGIFAGFKFLNKYLELSKEEIIEEKLFYESKKPKYWNNLKQENSISRINKNIFYKEMRNG